MKTLHLLGAVSALILAMAGLSIWLPTSAVAGSYKFTKIVDTNDVIPGGADIFTNFGYPKLQHRPR